MDSKKVCGFESVSERIRRPYIIAITSVYTSGPAICVPWLSPPGVWVNIVRYRDMKRHDISISWMGYDMNPKDFGTIQNELAVVITHYLCGIQHMDTT